MHKSFLLDFIKSFLLGFISMEQFLEGKKTKITNILQENQEKPSTSTKAKPKIKEKAKNIKKNSKNIDENLENEPSLDKKPANSCEICNYELFDEDFHIQSLQISDKKSHKSSICLCCYLEQLKDSLNFPSKPDFSLEKLFQIPQNPLYFHILLHIFNENSLKSFKFNSTRQFFLSDWLHQVLSKNLIKKPYIPILQSIISSNFNPKTAITFMKEVVYEPNEFLMKFVRTSLIFSEETIKISSALKSSLLLLSNENTAIRNKVLEIVQSIVNKSPEMIFNQKIQDIITQRVLDSTVSVRNSALNIIMRFYENNFIEENFYFEILLERLNDIDSGLRKRILGFFMDNVRTLKTSPMIMEKVLKAAVYKIYDNEEISFLALNVVCGLMFEGFSDKIKKNPRSRKKSEKEKLLEYIESNVIKKNIKACRDLCIILRNNDWLIKAIKHSAINQEKIQNSQEEIKGFIALLINDLAIKHTEKGILQENLVNLEMLLAFSKFYSIFLSQELNFLSNYLKYLAEMSLIMKKNDYSISFNEVLSMRKQAILILLEILDSLLLAQDENDVKNKTFVENFKEIEQLLIKFIQEEALEILHKALKLLISSVKKATENYFLIKNIYIQTYAFVLKKKATLDLSNKEALTADNIQHFMRSLYILTFLTRYFDISEFFDEEEQEKPEFQEENLIKIIYNELIFFCKFKHPIIEQTCIECLMILWEKLPILIFETRGFIEKYLADVSLENREIIEKIYQCFLNILLRHEEKIRRQNSLNRHMKNKLLEKQNKKKKKGKKLKDLEENEESEEDELIYQKNPEIIDEKDYEKLAVMIREMTKGSFSLHIFNSEASLRSKILHLLETLIVQGHISSYEIIEYFICFLTDSNEEIRALCEEMLKIEWKNSKFNVLGSLNKGIKKGYEYLMKRGGKAMPFLISGEENEVNSFYKGINRILSRNNDELENHFQILLIENYSLYSNSNDRDYLNFICMLLLTLEEYNVWEIYEVLLRLFAMISKNFYKNIKLIKNLGLKKEGGNNEKKEILMKEDKNKEEKKASKNKEESLNKDQKSNESKKEEENILKEDLNNCFNLLIELLAFHLFIIHSKGIKDICSGPPQECLDKLERYIKKNPYIKQKENVEPELENLKKKSNFTLNLDYENIMKFEEFIDKNLDFESFIKNKENIYLLYKKIKFLFTYDVSDDLEVLFSFNQEMLEKYREETNLWSKKKSKIKRRRNSEEKIEKKASKAKKNKKVMIDEEKTKIFMEKKKKEKKKEKNEELDGLEDQYKYKGRLRKRGLVNMKEGGEEE